MEPAPDLLGLPLPDLARALDALGVGARHAARVFKAVHRDQRPLAEVNELGWRVAGAVAEGTWRATARVARTVGSGDGTERLVIELGDGKQVEAVLIPMSKGRSSLCVSSQVGCAMACTFCATGTLGLDRPLRAGEIIAQVHAARAHAAASGRALGGLVFMGMGEPLHHYAHTRDAVRVLLDPHGLCMGSKRITVSTVGIVPRMREFSADFGGRVGLALSLHAGTDATRRRIVPMAARYDLASLRAALLDHPLPGSRWLMLEYVVLPGLNDTDDEIDATAAFTRGLDAVVNLIPFNPFPGAPFRSPSTDEIRRVEARFHVLGVPVTVRWPKGRDAAGACGQLALREAG